MRAVKQRMREAILPRQPADREDLARLAREYRSLLRADGTWSGVEYDSRVRSNWPAVDHLKRVLVLAKAWATPGHPLSGDARLLSDTLRSLDWWLQHDLQNANWWQNQVGVPQVTGEIALLVDKELAPRQREKVMEILSRSQWTPGQGQNTVWLAANAAVRGLLQGDADLVDQAFKAIWDEVHIAPPPQQGIQPDASFHQHGPQLYNGGYGLVFGNDVTRYMAHTLGTRFEAPGEKVKVLSDYLLDGQQWMIRGRTFDYSAVGRQIVREGKVADSGVWTSGPLYPPGAAYGLMNAVGLMAAQPVPRQEEFRGFAARLRREPDAPPLIGNRHFWKSDYMTHHRPGFFTSVKMFSNRTLAAEEVNDEGRRSFHLSDGATFIYRDGEEYHDIFAVWDWHRVPGTTVEVWSEWPPTSKVWVAGRKGFVGGVSDGTHGMAAMDLERDALSVRKAWFFFEEGFVALGSGINDTSDFPVLTSVQQSWLRGPLHLSGETVPIPSGERALEDARWVLHDGIGYVFPEGQRVILKNASQSGRWSDIGTGSTDLRAGNVFSLWIEHGVKPKDASYVYAVLPNATRKDLDVYARRPSARVLSNTPALQAVRHEEANMLQAAFYRPGVVDGGRGWVIAANRPCLVQVREEADGQLLFAVSNPANAPLTVHVTTDRRLSGEGAVAAGAGSRITFELPAGHLAGSSVVRRLSAG